MPTAPSFLFVTCQVHAEAAVKQELAREWPALRFAYSRPGFLTFKLPRDQAFADDFDLRSVFARSYGLSLGKARGTTPEELAASVWELAGNRPVEALHVWQRDLAPPGVNDFEPGITPLASMVEQVVRSRAPASFRANNQPPLMTEAGKAANPGRTDGPGDPSHGRHGGKPLILDCVVVETSEWWVGYHRANTVPTGWPGGFLPAKLPSEAVSRGYLKVQEMLLWTGLPVQAGQRCVEVGCAPGGATQALLQLGLRVTGIDPAQMDPVVFGDPNFTHIRERAKDVSREAFVRAEWLVVDINLTPNYALDAVEAIIRHPGVNLRGVLMTLKLGEWSLAAEVPAYLDRMRSWGFPTVRARQLHHNRQEICAVASK